MLSSISIVARSDANLKRASSKAVKSAALCAIALSLLQAARADTTTINGPFTETLGPTSPPSPLNLNGDDTLTIGPAGSVTVPGSNTTTLGISATGSSNTITNSGSISTAGEEGYGINANGGSNTITNSGSINTAGRFAVGIFAIGDSSTIANSGSISPAGQDGYGIYAVGGSSAITNSGSISIAGDFGGGIIAGGTSNAITNSGSISVAGRIAYGINARGSSNTITNSGSISTEGQEGHGMIADGTSNTIWNSGSISTAGTLGAGIAAVGVSNTISNSGSIRSAGENGHGIGADGGSNTITNSGSISTEGQEGHGMIADGGSSVMTNSGSISTTGNGAHGVYAYDGGSSVIINSGSINVSGVGSTGIYAIGSNNTVTNSGDIISQNGYAVYFDGSGNTFNSVNNFISGGLSMGSGGTVNITTGANYSKLYTFEGSLSAISGSGPVPLFKSLATQQAGTYDPTLFASSFDALADMATTISSMIPGRFNGSDNHYPVWAKGFGIKSSYAGTSATLDRNYSFSGVAIGYDAMRTKDLTLGVMGGYGQSGQTADGKTAQSFNSASDDGFMGIYGQKRWKNLAVDVAIYGGAQNFQQQRYVNDNLAYLGNSSAKASYQGWWVSPEAGVTYDAGMISGWTILPTARLRYAQQWLGGYTESGGGAANASVSGRSVAIGQGFIGIGTRKTIKTNLGNDTKMVLDGQIGYLYRGVVGDNTVGVTMIGQSLALPTEASSRSAVAVSAGVSLDLSKAVALKIRGDFEAGGGMNYVGGGWAGLSVKF